MIINNEELKIKSWERFCHCEEVLRRGNLVRDCHAIFEYPGQILSDGAGKTPSQRQAGGEIGIKNEKLRIKNWERFCH
ncbi:MAG: hypothetical protein V3574_03935 [Candidatus Moraniibacteriota bacterium]